MDTTDELSHHSSNIIGLHIEDKEKERMQFRVKHVYFETNKTHYACLLAWYHYPSFWQMSNCRE